MNDRGWLAFGGRARNPQPAQQLPSHHHHDMTARRAPTIAQRSLQRSLTQIPSQEMPRKNPRLSRISSYISLGVVAKSQSQTPSPTTPVYPELTMERSESMRTKTVSYHEAAHDPTTGIWRSNTIKSEYSYRESDCTWYNPTLKQMMETVSSAIMTNGVSAPLPRHLNGFVAGIIEEVSHQFSKIKQLQGKVDELQNTRKQEVQAFAAMADEWKEREVAFRAEINRLEHIIANTQLGAESMILARAASVCDRNDGRAFKAKLKRLSRNEDENLESENNYGEFAEEERRKSLALPAVVESFPNTLGSRPRVLLDSQSDVLISEQFRQVDSSPERKHATQKNKAAAKIVFDANGQPQPVRGTAPSKASIDTSSSSQSDVSSSGSSVSLTTTRANGNAVAQPHVTPYTSPPHEPPVKPSGVNILGNIQELVKQNGGLPEDAIDDSSSYTGSIIPTQHCHAFSFNAGEDSAFDNQKRTVKATVAASDTKCKRIQAQGRRPVVVANLKNRRRRAKGRRATRTSSDESSKNSSSKSKQTIKTNNTKIKRSDQVVSPVNLNRQCSDESKDSRSSSDSSNSCGGRSSILLSMGHNLVGDFRKNSEGAFRGSESSRTSTSTIRHDGGGNSSPTRRSQSAEVPILDQETIEISRRQENAILSARTGRAFFSDEELLITDKTRGQRP